MKQGIWGDGPIDVRIRRAQEIAYIRAISSCHRTASEPPRRRDRAASPKIVIGRRGSSHGGMSAPKVWREHPYYTITCADRKVRSATPPLQWKRQKAKPTAQQPQTRLGGRTGRRDNLQEVCDNGQGASAILHGVWAPKEPSSRSSPQGTPPMRSIQG